METKKIVDFKVVVRSKEDPVEAVKMLAQYINPDSPDCLDSVDMDFVSKQDYITVVPIEIALSVSERRSLQESNPDIRVIVTGVTEANVSSLVDRYGYTVLEPEPKVEEPADIVAGGDTLALSDTIEFAGKTYTVKELGEIVANHEKAKEQVAEMKKRFDADPFFKDFFKDGLW